MKKPLPENIGENGEFVGLYKVIVIERKDERIFVSKDGVELGRCAPEHTPERAAVVPAVQADRVLEYAVRRVGVKHAPGDLEAVRDLIRDRGGDQALRIVDLFGWSGEVSLAMCDPERNDSITLIDSLTGVGRPSLMATAESLGVDSLGGLQGENLGDLRETRIFPIRAEPNEVVVSFDSPQELDVVFIDTASEPSRMAGQMQAWAAHLAPGGILVGVNGHSEQVAKALGSVFGSQGVPVKIDSESSLWVVEGQEYMDAMFGKPEESSA